MWVAVGVVSGVLMERKEGAIKRKARVGHSLVEIPGQEEVFVSDRRRQRGVGGASSLSSEINALIRYSSRWEVRLLIGSKATNYGGIRG